jgi:hypothetical protein
MSKEIQIEPSFLSFLRQDPTAAFCAVTVECLLTGLQVGQRRVVGLYLVHKFLCVGRQSAGELHASRAIASATNSSLVTSLDGGHRDQADSQTGARKP